MDLENKLLLRVMRRLISELEILAEDDLAALVDLKGSILFTRASSLRVPTSVKRLELSGDQIEAFRNRLNSLPTREAGEKMLNAEALGRSQLIQIAKAIDIPVDKRHTRQEIIEKITTATIGFRTRSAAIRGQDARL